MKAISCCASVRRCTLLKYAGLLFVAIFVLAAAEGKARGLKSLAVGAGTSSTNQTNPYYAASDPTGTWVGSVTSQADSVIHADAARSMFGVDGSGIKIGIISDSYNAAGGAAAGVAAGDLPGPGNPNNYLTPVTVLNDSAGSDEGRGIAELIHDIAPGAQLFFHSAFNNAEASPGGSIGVAINNLAAAGVDLIVDDVFNLTMPIFQDGASAQAANAAFNAGIGYFSSAGNSADNSYEGAFNGSGAGHPLFGVGNAHDFDPGVGVDTVLNLGMLAPGSQVRATLWWDDPYSTVGGAPTADIDFAIIDVTNNALADFSFADQLNGADAYEFVNIINPFAVPIEVGLVVEGFAGNLTKGLKILVSGLPISDPNDTNSPTIFGHNSATGAVAVAAQRYDNPTGGAPPDGNVEFFSSEGPTTILFDTAGNPLVMPEIRNTPQITGIDGTNTSFFPPGPLAQTDYESDGFPNFFGTSAAAQHVAAVAALVLERAANLGINLTPAELYTILYNSTIDIETVGFDNLSGYGRLDAKLAVSALVPEPATLTLLALIGCVTLASGRWRRR